MKINYYYTLKELPLSNLDFFTKNNNLNGVWIKVRKFNSYILTPKFLSRNLD